MSVKLIYMALAEDNKLIADLRKVYRENNYNPFQLSRLLKVGYKTAQGLVWRNDIVFQKRTLRMVREYLDSLKAS